MSFEAFTFRNWNRSIAIERMLVRANAVLYRAKSEGRTRTAVAGELTVV